MKLYWTSFPHNQGIESINKYQMRWVPLLDKLNLYYLDLGYYPFNTSCHFNSIISGNFESIRYFMDYQAQIKEEITPKYPVLSKNKDMMQLIQRTNSVCISIRRGDYIDNADTSKLLNVCTRNYFSQAIAYMLKHIYNPVFFVFSDDIEWVRNNWAFPKVKCYYEDGDDPVWEKLRLMYSCKHFIISNSTFSWWAQYLGKNPEKIVIAPEKWYNSEFKPDIFQEEWVRL